MWGGKRGLRGSPREPPQAIVFTRPLHISFLKCVLAGTRQAWELITKCLHTAYKEIKNPYGGAVELHRDIFSCRHHRAVVPDKRKSGYALYHNLAVDPERTSLICS